MKAGFKHTAAYALLATTMLGSQAAVSGRRSVDDGVTEQEIEHLEYVREEEKLARDVYLRLHDIWGLGVFSKIAESEQIHTDAVRAKLEKYGLTDPVVEDVIGEFDNHDLQVLYDALIDQGSQSEQEALWVGCAIEEIDMLDLQDAIDHAEHRDIARTYQNLMLGTENHLRAFVEQLENGSERIVRLQGPGNAFGLEAWFDQPYQNTAVVLQRLDLCRIPVAVLRSINSDRPQLSRQLQRQWEAALETADFWIANPSTGTMRLRATWLIRFLLDVNGGDNARLRLLGTGDMADILGASKETVCRLMSELKQAGILSRTAPKTYTCDLAALDGYARGSSA